MAGWNTSHPKKGRNIKMEILVAVVIVLIILFLFK